MPTSTPPTRPPRSSALRLGAVVALALVAAWPASHLFEPAPPPVPTARWTHGLPATASIDPAAALPEGEPLTLDLTLPSPMHVYVAAWNLVDGTVALFPSETLRADRAANPLPAGQHRLPGQQGATRLHWHASDAALTTFVVIASPTPLPDLEDRLHRCRQVGNAAFPGREVLGRYAPKSGIANVPGASEPAHPLLTTCARAPTASHDGPLQPLPDVAGAWYATLLVRVEQTAPATPGDLREELRATAAELEDLARRFGPAPVPAPAPAPPAGR
ncbi:MAG: DUF4384 domain-containing protein [Planctomycetes bacterium]|nr:DUF4384 domain-containing protein [Planctomycetota bacterium]